ncbi:hypothetical protein C1I94_10335 [Akkermansia muciniphila]|nr:hypothetical protein C1I94_10335 [Akkermansia muciniphila]QAA48899.1 hypothetical protein C1O40_10360 [Akkermansia muciniphila]
MDAGSPEAQLLSCLSKYPSSRQILSTGVSCFIRRQGDERNERRFSGGGRIAYGSEDAGNRETRQDGTVFVSQPGRTGCCLLPVRFPETGVSCPLFCAAAFFSEWEKGLAGTNAQPLR